MNEENTDMESVAHFLAYSIKLEEEAALRFDQLADAMLSAGNHEVGKLFRRLADYSRLHMRTARDRSGFHELPKFKPGDFNWPDIESPETAAIWAADPFLCREQALEVALEAESASLAYYRNILESTQDPEIRAFAKEFVEEETEHVAELQRWLSLHHSGQPLPV